MAKNKVDGVYDKDPRANPTARKFEQMTYIQGLNLGLDVMDNTALSLCMDNDLPIVVFDLASSGNLVELLEGKVLGTLITGAKNLAKMNVTEGVP